MSVARKKLLALFNKELNSYFVSPMAYIFTMIFLIIAGYFFWVILLDTRQAAMRDTFSVIGSVLLFVTPMLTMRLLAEERKAGTIELLYTSPLSSAQIVVGKFMAAWTIYTIMFAFTLSYPVILFALGRPEVMPLITGYGGLILMAGCYTAVGLFASSLTENQLIAGIISFALLLAFLVIDWLKIYLTSPLAESVVKHVSFFEHYDGLRKGVVGTTDIAYFVFFIFFMLFATTRIVEMERNR